MRDKELEKLIELTGDNYSQPTTLPLRTYYLTTTNPWNTKGVFDEIASNVQVIVPVGSEAAYKADENWKELFKETTEISSIEAAKGNAKVKKLFRNGKIYIGDYTIAGLRVL